MSDGGAIKDLYKQELAVNNIPFEEGHHSWDVILGADEIVKSPGIPEKTELMKKYGSAEFRLFQRSSWHGALARTIAR